MTIGEMFEFLKQWIDAGHEDLMVVVNEDLGIHKAQMVIDNGGDGWLSIVTS